MVTLTAEIKRQLTTDWQRAFPELGIYKPMWLLRQCGPLLAGICLDRSGSGKEYIPTAHIHCLAYPQDDIYFGLAQRLCTARTLAEDWISVKWHERHWKEAAERLSRQSLIPLAGPVSLEQVGRAFREVPHRYDAIENMSLSTYRDWLLTLAWAGHVADARDILSEAEIEIAKWPRHIIEREGGLAAWLKKMEHLVSDPTRLRRTVERERMKHKTNTLPGIDVSTWAR